MANNGKTGKPNDGTTAFRWQINWWQFLVVWHPMIWPCAAAATLSNAQEIENIKEKTKSDSLIASSNVTDSPTA